MDKYDSSSAKLTIMIYHFYNSIICLGFEKVQGGQLCGYMYAIKEVCNVIPVCHKWDIVVMTCVKL